MQAEASHTSDELFLQILKEVVGTPAPFVPLHEPEFTADEKSILLDCIESTFVSSVGQYVVQFEQELANYTGAKYAVAVVNGTAGLHIALLLAGVKEKDEVLVPALSFVATANAVAYCGGIPHFVDSETEGLGLDVDKLGTYLAEIAELSPQGLRNKRTGRRIAALVPMHTFGHPVNMGALMCLANKFGLPIVEDATESLGSFYKGQHTGTFGELGVISFNGNKVITTGGGGMIMTDSRELAQKAKHLTTTAKVAHKIESFHDAVAWNYRLPNLNAALGCAQLKRLPDILTRKKRLAEVYKEKFSSLPGFAFVSEPKDSDSNYWLNTVRLLDANIDFRDRLLALAHDFGYQCRPTWTLLNELPMYKDCPNMSLDGAHQLAASLINLPSSAKLAEKLDD